VEKIAKNLRLRKARHRWQWIRVREKYTSPQVENPPENFEDTHLRQKVKGQSYTHSLLAKQKMVPRKNRRLATREGGRGEEPMKMQSNKRAHQPSGSRTDGRGLRATRVDGTKKPVRMAVGKGMVGNRGRSRGAKEGRCSSSREGGKEREVVRLGALNCFPVEVRKKG